MTAKMKKLLSNIFPWALAPPRTSIDDYMEWLTPQIQASQSCSGCETVFKPMSLFVSHVLCFHHQKLEDGFLVNLGTDDHPENTFVVGGVLIFKSDMVMALKLKGRRPVSANRSCGFCMVGAAEIPTNSKQLYFDLAQVEKADINNPWFDGEECLITRQREQEARKGTPASLSKMGFSLTRPACFDWKFDPFRQVTQVTAVKCICTTVYYMCAYLPPFVRCRTPFTQSILELLCWR